MNWQEWFEGFTISHTNQEVTILTGTALAFLGGQVRERRGARDTEGGEIVGGAVDGWLIQRRGHRRLHPAV